MKSKGIKVGKEFLEVGDILIQQPVGIEVKRGQDLTSSMMSNRLFDQLNNLSNFDIPILAIVTENKYRNFYRVKSNYIYDQYVGMLSTIILSYPKVRIVFLENDDELIDLIVSIYKKLNKEGKSSRPKPILRKPRSMSDSQENILCAIKGISVPTAKKLLKHYGKISNVVNATVEEHQKIDKVGKALATRIYEICNDEYKKNNSKKK